MSGSGRSSAETAHAGTAPLGLLHEVLVQPAQNPALGTGAPLETARDRGHGRAETRTVKAITLTGQAGFPHAAQAVRVHRYVTDVRTGMASWTCAYAVTSLPAGWVAAARLGALERGYWNIEAFTRPLDVLGLP